MKEGRGRKQLEIEKETEKGKLAGSRSRCNTIRKESNKADREVARKSANLRESRYLECIENI